ncbi:GNAT family N-acetyltransferase [Streptomyces sp. NPDC059816]|uniref:GNAT family N-acetyltransferase n=1 Tax=Streptomyces sp. NPDC059816 TaxID=3346960 RepID=UPI00366591EA
MIRTARPGDGAALHALWAVCFPTARHLPALHALDPGRHHRTFVAARTDGTLDAVVVYVPRTLRDATGTAQRVGGIGSVATRPEARGRGLVGELLARAVDTMAAEGCAWSLLFTGTPGVYRGSGWREFHRPRTEGALPARNGRNREGTGRYRVRSALPADAPAVIRLQSAHNAARPLSAVRDADDWRVRVPAWYGPDCWSLLAERRRGGPPSGWLVARPVGPDRVDVLETAREPAEPDVLTDLYAELALRARTAGRTRVRLFPPPCAASRRAAPLLIAAGTAVEAVDPTGMARPLTQAPDRVGRTLTAPGAVHWYGDSF